MSAKKRPIINKLNTKRKQNGYKRGLHTPLLPGLFAYLNRRAAISNRIIDKVTPNKQSRRLRQPRLQFKEWIKTPRIKKIKDLPQKELEDRIHLFKKQEEQLQRQQTLERLNGNLDNHARIQKKIDSLRKQARPYLIENNERYTHKVKESVTTKQKKVGTRGLSHDAQELYKQIDNYLTGPGYLVDGETMSSLREQAKKIMKHKKITGKDVERLRKIAKLAIRNHNYQSNQ